MRETFDSGAAGRAVFFGVARLAGRRAFDGLRLTFRLLRTRFREAAFDTFLVFFRFLAMISSSRVIAPALLVSL
jgi:hypothetical protein